MNLPVQDNPSATLAQGAGGGAAAGAIAGPGGGAAAAHVQAAGGAGIVRHCCSRTLRAHHLTRTPLPFSES